jgi:hypothetical protein
MHGPFAEFSPPLNIAAAVVSLLGLTCPGMHIALYPFRGEADFSVIRLPR